MIYDTFGNLKPKSPAPIHYGTLTQTQQQELLVSRNENAPAPEDADAMEKAAEEALSGTAAPAVVPGRSSEPTRPRPGEESAGR